MSYANGRCIVTKQVGPCLVLPAGSFSPHTISFLSKEGADKLVEAMKACEEGVPGICVINRKHYDECAVIPRGLINPKLRYLMSPEAIEGMASAAADIPTEVVEDKPAPEPKLEPTPVEEPSKETAIADGGEIEPETKTTKKSKKKSGIPKKTYADPSSGETIEEE
jgi:hypothetical protein